MAIITGTPVSDLLSGTEGDEVLRGLEGNDAILGNSGDDQIDGGSGNDSLSGNQGNDSLFGGAGDDSLFGGQGNDLVIGEAGNDFIAGDVGVNQLTGGIGRDTFVVTSGGTATITDFFAGDDLIGLSGDLTFDQVNLVQTFANTLVVDRRTGETLATLNNVNSSTLRSVNFVDAETRQPVEAPAVVVPLVDVTAVDPIALANNPDDPIVFVVSRTNNTGDLVVNFTLTTSNGVVIAQVPNTVRIPVGQFAANVVVPAQSTSRDGTVTFTLQDAAAYDVRAAVANGTVVAPVLPTTPVPAPAPPDAPTVVDLVLTRVDTPATPAAGENVTSVFTVQNRGTGQADRVVFSTTLPVDAQFVSAVPSQGTFNNFAGTSAREGNVAAELGSLAPNATATITVVYAPRTTGNVVLTSSSVTSAQPDVDPSNNFANAQFTVIPAAPVLPVVTISAPDVAAIESNTTIQENAGAVAQNFTITRSGGNVSQPLTVNFQISGDAQNTTDFEPIGSSVTFAPFETTRTVRILPVQDRQVEETESVTLTLVPNALTYSVGATDAATILITDVPNPITPNPLPAVVSIVAIDSAAEEADGVLPDAQSDSPRRGAFRISRDNSVGNLQVNLEVTGNADSSDFTLSTSTTINGVSALTTIDDISTITIPDGAQFIDLIVTAVGDNLSEGFEDVIVNVAPGVGYQIGRPQDVASDNPAFVRIRDNDTPPNVSITAVDAIGDELGDTITFAVSRTGDLSGARAVVVELPRGFTIGADPDGTGPLTGGIVLDSDTAGRPRQIQRNGNFDVDGEDYDVTGPNVFLGLSTLSSNVGASVGNLSQFPPDSTSNRFLVVIPAGESSTEITLTPINDRIVETVESVVARIVPPPLPDSASGIVSPSDIPPGGFIVTGGAAEAFILDSDATQTLRLTATDPTAIEGGDDATLTISRTGDTSRAIDVPLAIISAQATQETIAVPFAGADPVLVTSAPVVIPAFVTIPAGQRSVTLTATQTIPVPPPVGATVTESQQVIVTSTLTISRTGSVSIPLELPQAFIQTALNAGANDANIGSDFSLPESVLIPAGNSSATVPIEGLLDGIVEGSEGFAVIMGGNVQGFQTIGQPAAFTIQDADAVGTIDVTATTSVTTEGANTPGAFTITIDGDPDTAGNQPLATPIDVPFTLGGTATPGSDFTEIGRGTGVNRSVTVPAGQTQVTFNVNALNDLLAEDVETVVTTLAPLTGFNVSGTPSTVFIQDNSATPTLAIVALDPVASELSFKTAVFEVRRTGPNNQPLTVPFTILPSGATPAQPGQDFFALPPTQVTIPTGQNSAVITIFPNDDITGEGFEQFTITLLPIPGFAIANGGSVIGFVTDDPIQVPFFLGTPATDRIEGTTDDDVLSGADGADTIDGDAGNDVLNGDAGDDSLLGNDGNDRLNGGDNNDILDGGGGNDTLDGNTGGDLLIGGTGADRFLFSAIDPQLIADLIADFIPGTDLLVFNSAPFGLNVTPSQNIDPSQFQAVANFGAIIENPFVPTIIYVGGGTDSGINGQLFFAPSGVPAGGAGALPGDAILLAQFTNAGPSPVLTTANIQVIPSLGQLTVGNLDANLIAGTSGNDTLIGNDGDDTLDGNVGGDTLNGGNGNDVLVGGPGPDNLTGGSGFDLFFLNLRQPLVPTLNPNNSVAILGTNDIVTDFSIVDTDRVVLNTVEFDLDLTVSPAILDTEFQTAVNQVGIIEEASARILYLQDTGTLFYTPSGITADGAFPGDEILIGQFNPGGTFPLITNTQIQVILQ